MATGLVVGVGSLGGDVVLAAVGDGPGGGQDPVDGDGAVGSTSVAAPALLVVLATGQAAQGLGPGQGPQALGGEADQRGQAVGADLEQLAGVLVTDDVDVLAATDGVADVAVDVVHRWASPPVKALAGGGVDGVARLLGDQGGDEGVVPGLQAEAVVDQRGPEVGEEDAGLLAVLDLGLLEGLEGELEAVGATGTPQATVGLIDLLDELLVAVGGAFEDGGGRDVGVAIGCIENVIGLLGAGVACVSDGGFGVVGGHAHSNTARGLFIPPIGSDELPSWLPWRLSWLPSRQRSSEPRPG